MTPPASTTAASEVEALREDVIEGLSRRPRSLPCRWLYDATGAALFEHITRLEEYYPTRLERGLLRRYSASISRCLPGGCHLIELGSGEGTKVESLLRATRAAVYTPVDVAEDQLRRVERRLAGRLPWLRVRGLVADFTRLAPKDLDPAPALPRVLCFLGSTIGNFEPSAAAALLRSLHQFAGRGASLLIGFDREKDPQVIRAAYNDRSGVTAAFNRNIIDRLRRDLGWEVDGRDFDHHADYQPSDRRIEMRLVARQDVALPLPGADGLIRAGESIVTEHSYKYTARDISALAEAGGWTMTDVWNDARTWFTLALLRG
jgi:L-histidine N-alpha-methyltransferase